MLLFVMIVYLIARSIFKNDLGLKRKPVSAVNKVILYSFLSGWAHLATASVAQPMC